MSRIDGAQLAAFAAVVEEGSFEAAARRLHITPSAVSQRVKALESGMGQILVRRTRPAQPTDAGQVLVRLAGQVALLEDEALAATIGDADGPVGLRMPLAVNADSLATWFLPVLAALSDRGGVCFDIHAEDQDHSAALLRDGTVMAAVTADPRPVQGCRVEALGSMRYRAVAAPGFHRVHLSGRPLASALAQAPMLVFNRKDRLQQRFIEAVTPSRLEPPVTFLPSSAGFVEAARLGLAWGMLPEQMLGDDLAEGRLVELASDLPLDVPLYWQRWRLDSALLTALTEAVRTTAAKALT